MRTLAKAHLKMGELFSQQDDDRLAKVYKTVSIHEHISFSYLICPRPGISMTF